MDNGEIHMDFFFSIPALANCNVRRSLEEDTVFRQAKKPVDVLTTICNLYFIGSKDIGKNLNFVSNNIYSGIRKVLPQDF